MIADRVVKRHSEQLLSALIEVVHHARAHIIYTEGIEYVISAHHGEFRLQPGNFFEAHITAVRRVEFRLNMRVGEKHEIERAWCGSAAAAKDGSATVAPAVAIVLRKFLRSMVIVTLSFEWRFRPDVSTAAKRPFESSAEADRSVKVQCTRRPVKIALMEQSHEPASSAGSHLGSASGPPPVTAQDSAPPTGFRLGSIFGIPIYLHASWFIIFFLITLSLRTQFTSQHTDWSPAQHWALGIITSIFFSLP